MIIAIHVIVKGTITAQNKVAQDQPNNAINNKVIFKNCGSFTNCISRINNTQVDDAHDIDVVMLMDDLIEYSDNYSKISRMLLKHCRHKLALAANDVTDFTVADAINDSFKIKEKIADEADNNGQKQLFIC